MNRLSQNKSENVEDDDEEEDEQEEKNTLYIKRSTGGTQHKMQPLKKKGAAHRIGGQEITGVERENVIVIRNDHGPAQVSKCYGIVPSSGDDDLIIRKLTSPRYVVPGSTLLLATHAIRDGKFSSTVELAASLDGPVYRPLSNESNSSFIGKTVLVTDIKGAEWLGVVRSVQDDPFTVDLFVLKDKHEVRMLCTHIQLVEPSDPLWNVQMQDLHIRIPSSKINRVYLHYQMRRNLFQWSPKYRLVVHPSFRSALSLRCTATITNASEENLRVQQVKLRLVRDGGSTRETVVTESRAMMMAPQSIPSRDDTPSVASSQQQILQEFSVTLPNQTLPARKSCDVSLFQVPSLPITSWYELDVDSMQATMDSEHAPVIAPNWFLRVENPRTQSMDVKMEETSIVRNRPTLLSKSKTSSTPSMNWPSGQVQILLPSSMSADTVQPDQVNWLNTTVLLTTPIGESAVLSLQRPWDVSTKIVVSIGKRNSETSQSLIDVTSQIQIELSNNSDKTTRFPLRLRISMPSSSYQQSVAQVRISSFSWTGRDLSGTSSRLASSTPVRANQDGSYYILNIPSLSANFKQVLSGTVSWQETSKSLGGEGMVDDEKSFYRRSWARYGGIDERSVRSNENQTNAELSTLSALSQTSIPRPHYVTDTQSRLSRRVGGKSVGGRTTDELPVIHEINLDSVTPGALLPVEAPAEEGTDE
jgi:hypothetical protein